VTDTGFALFDTPIGRCGIAWGSAGIAGVQLPEARDGETRARLLRRVPNAREGTPPPGVRRAQAGIVALLAGRPSDLSEVVLDMTGVPRFQRRVYETLRQLPPGETISYGELAARLGEPGSARAVGQALGRNPFALVVPCHRVLAADGRMGGFSARGGVATKLRLLGIESAAASAQPGLFDGDGALGYDPRAAARQLRAADPALGRLMDEVGPFRLELKRAPSLFAALAETIVYQQLSPLAARTIFARVCALFPHGHRGPGAEAMLRISDARLRGAGVSRPKLLALRDLARRTCAGELPTLRELRDLDDEAIVERLSQVRGIGRWTAQMVLVFRLGRPDVLAIDDLGLRKGFAIAFGKRALPAPEDLEKHAERWRPYRSVASWYLWRATDLERPPVAGPAPGP
jgi:methylated-DNA-[protein]-cysteine S-methyltransferase